MEKYILTIDQSTSATKVMLFNRQAKLIDRISLEHKQFYPESGFVEHDPVEIYSNLVEGIHEIIKNNRLNVSNIVSISITNQRETALIWNKKTGKPVTNAAVWQCQRGAEICRILIEEGYSKSIKNKTGLIINSYFSASKLKWMMNQVSGTKQLAKQGDLLLGTMDSWLLWKLTDGKVHATDYSNACRTMLFNIHTLEWDKELIELFDLHSSMFPEVHFSDEIFGYSGHHSGIPEGIPISGLIGDSHAALFGQHGFYTGISKATYGTGSSIMMNIGKEPVEAPEGLVTSIGFGCNKKIDYVFEGNIHCTGDTLKWLSDNLHLIDSPKDAEPLANEISDNEGVYLVPAFVGLGAPYWDQDAKASITGLGRDTGKSHIVRAALESIAYQIKDLIDLMNQNSGVDLQELRVDGGPTRNKFLMQFQADILDRKVVCSGIEEISALGSAYLAGLATGFWKDISVIENLRSIDKSYEASLDADTRIRLYSGWINAVKKTRYKPKD